MIAKNVNLMRDKDMNNRRDFLEKKTPRLISLRI
jgi:hypothetical protein